MSKFRELLPYEQRASLIIALVAIRSMVVCGKPLADVVSAMSEYENELNDYFDKERDDSLRRVEALNQRVPVENALREYLAGKRSMFTVYECQDFADRLGLDPEAYKAKKEKERAAV